jgi:hypothetical protein
MLLTERELRVRAELERRQRKRAQLARAGWHEVLSDEMKSDPLFDHFFRTFFSSDKASLPQPYTTWDVSHATHLPYDCPEQRQFLDDLHQKCLRILKRCNPSLAPWFVIENVHHTWYRLHPDEIPDDFGEWPVGLLPLRDMCYLVSHNLSCGIFVELDQTVSVFGQHLLSEITSSLPLVLSKIVRSHNPDVSEESKA